MSPFDYQQALDYLYSFVDYSLTRQLRYSPDKFDLSRMQRFLSLLGDPHLRYPTVHVAGTKGKGSTAAMVASMLQAAGLRVGFYSSPHLEDFIERIQINQEPISHEQLAALVDAIQPTVARIERLTTFEITTAVAFQAFQQAEVDIAVIEVGLGGRLDATNVVKPEVAVITSISYDHTQVLGESLSQIAREKAGIIKPNTPVVVAPQRREALAVIREVAESQAASLILVGNDYRYAPVAHSLDGQVFWLWKAEEQPLMDRLLDKEEGLDWQPRQYMLPLLGLHQLDNAATAYAAIDALRERGWKIDDAAVADGFRRVKWPGRFEILNRFPFLVVDSAHNQDSALKLRLALEDYFPGKKAILIIGASEDKDIEGIFRELMPRTQQVIATRSFHPRAIDPQELAALARRFGCPARVIVPIEEALTYAIRLADEHTLVLATGSLFVAAAVRQCWRERFRV
jgi:dihydrofolate synthase/folylpolyglutamate synthase